MTTNFQTSVNGASCGSRQWQLVLLVAALTLVVLVLWMSIDSYYALRSLTFICPIALAAVLAIISNRFRAKSINAEDKSRTPPKSRMFYVVLSLFVSFGLLAIAARTQSLERSIYFFIFEGGMIFALSVQIFITKEWTRYRCPLILGEIGTITVIDILSKTISFPYYMGNSDITFHDEWASTIVSGGGIGSAMGVYLYFPVLHVLSAVISEFVPGFNTAKSIYVLFAVCGFVVPYVLHSISSALSTNSSFRVVYSFIGSLSYALLAYFSDGMPYALAFFFFLLTVMVALKRGSNARHLTLAAVLVSVLILTHQASVPYMILSLLFLMIVTSRSENHMGHGPTRIKPLLAILVLSYVAYSVCVSISFYQRLLSWPLLTGDLDLPTAPDSSSLSLLYFIGRLPFSLLVFFSMLGLLSISGYTYPFKRRKGWFVVVIIGLAAMILYTPGIISLIPLAYVYISVGMRNRLFAEQLVALFASFTFTIDAPRMRVLSKTVCCLCVGLIVLGGVMDSISTRDTSVFSGSTPKERVYFSAEELCSFDFVINHYGNLAVQSDFYSARYLESRGVLSEIPEVNADGSMTFEAGTVFLRYSELRANVLYFYNPSTGQAGKVLLGIDSDSYRSGVNVLFDSGACTLSEWSEYSYLDNQALTPQS